MGLRRRSCGHPFDFLSVRRCGGTFIDTAPNPSREPRWFFHVYGPQRVTLLNCQERRSYLSFGGPDNEFSDDVEVRWIALRVAVEEPLEGVEWSNKLSRRLTVRVSC